MNTANFTALLSVQFMIRNTAPVGWVPLLFVKVWKDDMLPWFALTALTIAMPILYLTVVLDSAAYMWLENRHLMGHYEQVITGWNFLRVNLFEHAALYFGAHPTWFYVGVYLPATFNLIYPLVIYSVVFYVREQMSK